uniref:Predicted protein n=1 Tax=Hordeum vulgare subsp. vulgare TaxID=112509 RepID=F2E0N5_HORVV|nr:predicted protein [Hordeum vulgare subsp. vulgare]
MHICNESILPGKKRNPPPLPTRHTHTHTHTIQREVQLKKPRSWCKGKSNQRIREPTKPQNRTSGINLGGQVRKKNMPKKYYIFVPYLRDGGKMQERKKKVKKKKKA